MPSPTPADLHVDQYLTNLSVSWVQDQARFVANRVFPVVPVVHQSDLYVIYDKGYFYRDEMQERPLGGEPADIGYGTAQGTYRCTEDAVRKWIDDRERANADNQLEPERAATRLLSQQAMIHLDRQWAADYFTTGIWGQTDQVGVASAPGANQFLTWEQSGATPIQTIRSRASAMAGSTGFRPNKLVLGNDVLDAIVNRADVIDRIKYTQRGIADLDLLAQLFGVDEVIVAQGVQNTAKEGQTNAISWIVNSKSALLVYAADTPSLDTPSGGYTFAWTGLIPGATNAMGGVVMRGRDDKRFSDYFVIRQAADTRVVASELGQFFSAAVV